MRILLATCLALVACLAPARAADAPLTVFAAASLKESMDEATLAFQRDTGQVVRVAYAGSSALARRIEQGAPADVFVRSEEHTSELQSLMRSSYAVFCLTTKTYQLKKT